MRRFPLPIRAAVTLALVAIAWLFSSHPLTAQEVGGDVARAFRDANGPRILRDYAQFLSMPNVASDSAGIWANATFIRDALAERGVEARLLTLPEANPIVYGEIRTPGATRTLGLYVHYDGQPANPANWTHEPWDPVLYTRSMEAGGEPRPFPEAGEDVDPEWRIYARSAGDDKAPIGAMLPVLEAFQESGVTPTSNLIFFFEGEEEAGSTNLGRYLESYPGLIEDIDVWILFDGPVHQSGKPMLSFGVRGVTGMEVTVYGPTRGLHSGHYGNWAPVPGQMLANLLASMKDDDGKVLIDGFYDTVEPLGALEMEALRNLPRYDEELMRELGLARTEGSGQTLPERLQLPSLTVRGLSSGNTGPLTQNVIPTTATAALGIRLVKGNDPGHMRELVETHIRRQGYHIVREDPDMETRLTYPRIAKVTGEGGYPAARSPMDLPILQEVVAAAKRAAGNDDVVLSPGSGGSLPLYLFTDVLRKPILMVPIANHDDLQHAPDENLRVWNLWYGIDFYAQLFTMPGN
ncbi:MAG: M20/M25/M40 family metallo-hydrolase [Longimicrobiales bacterium]|nr:M20/M25/M40 family metallo-hydrolase [Longimicrobiales bacterium]